MYIKIYIYFNLYVLVVAAMSFH